MSGRNDSYQGSNSGSGFQRPSLERGHSDPVPQPHTNPLLSPASALKLTPQMDFKQRSMAPAPKSTLSSSHGFEQQGVRRHKSTEHSRPADRGDSWGDKRFARPDSSFRRESSRDKSSFNRERRDFGRGPRSPRSGRGRGDSQFGHRERGDRRDAPARHGSDRSVRGDKPPVDRVSSLKSLHLEEPEVGARYTRESLLSMATAPYPKPEDMLEIPGITSDTPLPSVNLSPMTTLEEEARSHGPWYLTARNYSRRGRGKSGPSSRGGSRWERSDRDDRDRRDTRDSRDSREPLKRGGAHGSWFSNDDKRGAPSRSEKPERSSQWGSGHDASSAWRHGDEPVHHSGHHMEEVDTSVVPNKDGTALLSPKGGISRLGALPPHSHGQQSATSSTHPHELSHHHGQQQHQQQAAPAHPQSQQQAGAHPSSFQSAFQYPPQQQQQQPQPHQVHQHPPHLGHIHGGAPMHPVVKRQWFYQDPKGNVQGPFEDDDMRDWYDAGFFTLSLKVCTNISKQFVALGALFRDGNPAFLSYVPDIPAHAFPPAQPQQPPQPQQHHQHQPAVIQPVHSHVDPWGHPQQAQPQPHFGFGAQPAPVDPHHNRGASWGAHQGPPQQQQGAPQGAHQGGDPRRLAYHHAPQHQQQHQQQPVQHPVQPAQPTQPTQPTQPAQPKANAWGVAPAAGQSAPPASNTAPTAGSSAAPWAAPAAPQKSLEQIQREEQEREEAERREKERKAAEAREQAAAAAREAEAEKVRQAEEAARKKEEAARRIAEQRAAKKEKKQKKQAAKAAVAVVATPEPTPVVPVAAAPVWTAPAPVKTLEEIQAEQEAIEAREQAEWKRAFEEQRALAARNASEVWASEVPVESEPQSSSHQPAAPSNSGAASSAPQQPPMSLEQIMAEELAQERVAQQKAAQQQRVTASAASFGSPWGRTPVKPAKTLREVQAEDEARARTITKAQNTAAAVVSGGVSPAVWATPTSTPVKGPAQSPTLSETSDSAWGRTPVSKYSLASKQAVSSRPAATPVKTPSRPSSKTPSSVTPSKSTEEFFWGNDDPTPAQASGASRSSETDPSNEFGGPALSEEFSQWALSSLQAVDSSIHDLTLVRFLMTVEDDEEVVGHIYATLGHGSKVREFADEFVLHRRFAQKGSSVEPVVTGKKKRNRRKNRK